MTLLRSLHKGGRQAHADRLSIVRRRIPPRFAMTASLSLLSLLSPCLTAPAAAQAGDAIYDLGTLGGTSGGANAIVSSGMIVGWSTNASGQQRGTAWNFSTSAPYTPIPLLIRALPPAAGFTSSVAYAINQSTKRIVGSSSNTVPTTHATAWALSGGVWAGNPPFFAFDVHPTDGYPNSVARAVGNAEWTALVGMNPPQYRISSGDIVGTTYATDSPAAQIFGAQVWRDPSFTIYTINSNMSSSGGNQVGRLANTDVYGMIEDPAPHRKLVGCMWNDPTDPRAFYMYGVYDPFTGQSYTNWEKIAGDVDSCAYSISPQRKICGYRDTGNGPRGFMWIANNLTTLPTLGGNTEAFCIRESNSGLTTVVVGYSENASGPRAFLYYGGAIRDLNNYLPPNSGWTLLRARGACEMSPGRWLIVGDGQKLVNGVLQSRAFLFVVSGVPT